MNVRTVVDILRGVQPIAVREQRLEVFEAENKLHWTVKNAEERQAVCHQRITTILKNGKGGHDE